MTPPPHSVRVRYHNTSLLETIAQQLRVIGAIIVRDTKTRFGANAILFSISVFWAVVHAGIIMAVYLATARAPSHGTSLFQWSVSGGLPFVVFLYTFRFVGLSLSAFGSLLAFPTVKGIDILWARAILEMISSTLVAVMIIFMVYLLDPTFRIAHFGVMLQALGAAFFLGVGLGAILAPLAAISMVGAVTIALFPIVLWITSGALFLPDSLPHPYRDYLALNPLLHALEWVRTGIYDDYVSETLDRRYILGFACVCLLGGLAFQRAWRR